MCERGNTVPVLLGKDADGNFRWVDIDACIATLVQVLNLHGFPTRASCCGHGERPGSIALEDGRELIIARNYGEARSLDGRVFTTCSGCEKPLLPGDQCYCPDCLK